MTMNQLRRIPLHPTIIHQLIALFRHWPPSCLMHLYTYVYIENRFFLQCVGISSLLLVMPLGKTTHTCFVGFFFIPDTFWFVSILLSLFCHIFLSLSFFVCCWLLLYVQKRKEKAKNSDAHIFTFDDEQWSNFCYISLSLCLFSSLVFFSLSPLDE